MDELSALLNKKKGLVCNEFEKVCPSAQSLNRMIKEMHDIFRDLENELRKMYKGDINE